MPTIFEDTHCLTYTLTKLQMKIKLLVIMTRMMICDVTLLVSMIKNYQLLVRIFCNILYIL